MADCGGRGGAHWRIILKCVSEKVIKKDIFKIILVGLVALVYSG